MTLAKYVLRGISVLALIATASIPRWAMADMKCANSAVKIVIANPPGGTTDFMARVLSEKASAELGLPFMIENRPGATTTIGANYVAKSRPDGCTILTLTAAGVIASVYRDNLPYDLNTDFVPVAGIGSFPMVLAASTGSNIRKFDDVITESQKDDGITFGSGGAGSLGHLSTIRLLTEIKGKGHHIPFKGNSEAMHSLMANHVQLFFPSSAEALPLAKDGKIRLIGVTSPERLAALPDVPTMKELGLDDFNPRLWYGFVVPAGTPEKNVEQLRKSLMAAASDQAVQERFAALGFASEVADGQALQAHVEREAARWGKIIVDNHLKNAQ